VIDVGTGTGVIASALAELGYRVVGVDLSEEMLAQARSKVGSDRVRFDSGDAMNSPGLPEALDAIVSRHVLWTLTDPRRALDSWLRLLKRGGRVVIIDGMYGAQPDRRLGDIVASLPLLDISTTSEDVRVLVKESGFVDVGLHDLA